MGLCVDRSRTYTTDGKSLNKNRRYAMSVAKTSEITASSSKSFEDAVRVGVRKMAQTVKGIEGAWVKEQKVIVDDGKVVAYRVTMKITFIVK